MAEDAPQNPSDRSLAALRERITSDDALDAVVKEAILADLAGDTPAGLEKLKTHLSKEGRSDEADEPKGT